MARSVTAGVLRRSDRTILIVAAILALIAGALVFVAVSSSDSSSKTQTSSEAVAGTTNVVTASQDIPANTRLSAGMLSVAALPNANVLIGGYDATDSLIGTVTRYPILSGEQITTSKIGEYVKDDKSLALIVPDGYRAIGIPVTEENIAGGILLPGDLVDVIAVFSAQDAGVAKSVTLMQNVEVLAVGQKAEDPIARPSGTSAPGSGPLGQTPSDADAQPNASTVTLSVKPDQAAMLALTADNATLWLTVRGRGDNAHVDVGEANLEGIQTAIPAQQ